MALDELLARGDAYVRETHDTFLTIPGARLLTEDEIDDLLEEVIRAPVCILPDARAEIYRAHRARIAEGLRTVKLLPSAIPVFREYLALESLSGYAEPGTCIGGIVADNISHGTYQGTLNTRHTPGARHKASASIQGQKEVLQLYRRSVPVVVLAFTQRQTFYSIMRLIRPKLVEVVLRDAIVRDSLHTVEVREDQQPSWYTSTQSGYAVVFRVNRKVLYLHRITLEDIVDSLREIGMTAFHTPLSANEHPTMHVYTGQVVEEVVMDESTPTDDATETETITVSVGLRQQSALGKVFDTIRRIEGVRIAGLPGITDLVPFSVPVLSAFAEEEDGVVTLDPLIVKRTGITAKVVSELCVAAGLPPPVLLSLTSLRVVLPTRTTVKEYLQAAIDADALLQSEYENTQRNRRFAGESTLSILREPTPVEVASTMYFAEAAGGSLGLFVDADLSLGVPIDVDRSYSNDPWEAFAMWGVEGAHTFLEQEIHDQYAETGYPLETVSVSLIANAMTYHGVLTPVTHNGISTNDAGVLTQSTVQRPMTYFANAALNNRTDPVTSASACIMTGKAIKAGTGLPKVRSIVRLAAPPRPPQVITELNHANEDSQFVRDIDDTPITSS